MRPMDNMVSMQDMASEPHLSLEGRWGWKVPPGGPELVYCVTTGLGSK